MGTLPDTDARAVEHAIGEAITVHGRLDPGEIIVHYALVIETRRVDDSGIERIRRHAWTPDGSDPHLSYGLLAAAAEKILRKIS
jgi:hypothetical protein